MNAVPRPLAPCSPPSLGASQDRRGWPVRLLISLLLGLAALFWLTAPVTAAATLAEPACVSSLQVCADGATGASAVSGLDSDHGELADLDVHCAQLPLMWMLRMRQRPDSQVVAAVPGVQPWLPPPRRLG